MEHFGGRHASEPFPDLTERAREIRALVATGQNNAAIADRLMLAPKTVRNHISSILTKLQVPDHARAIIQALQLGLKANPVPTNPGTRPNKPGRRSLAAWTGQSASLEFQQASTRGRFGSD
jgi:DNA-binding CsgD family transcriptional regulator